MGNDYQLKKVYEQMVKGEPTPSTPQKPRTLKEAYEQKLVGEAVGFYAIDMKHGAAQPTFNQLRSLGVLDDTEEAEHVKNRIRSYQVSSETKTLLEASGWGADNPILNSKDLGMLVYDNNISAEFLKELVTKKNTLKSLDVKKTGSFNYVDDVLVGLKTIAPEEKEENLKKFIKTLTEKVGRIGGTDIGPGEMMLSLLTDASKSGKGDLKIPAEGGSYPVEIKACKIGEKGGYSSGTLGYAEYATKHLPKAMESLTAAVPNYKPNQALGQLKVSFTKYITDLEKQSKPDSYSPPMFTGEFFNKLRNLISIVQEEDVQKLIKVVKQTFNLDLANAVSYNNQSVNDFILDYKKRKYIDEQTAPPIDIFKQLIVLKGKKEGGIGVKSVLAELLYVANILQKIKNGEKVSVNEAEELSSDDIQPEVDQQEAEGTTKEKKKKATSETSLTVAFKQLFLYSNLNVTNEQLAAVLVEARPFDSEDVQTLTSEITTALSGGYAEKLKNHDVNALDALVFALHVSEYAKNEGFSYMLILNRTTEHALFIPARTTFTRLLKFYEQHQDNLKLVISLGGRQGAHKLWLKG